MAVFTTQLVLCKPFPEFQWTSFMVPHEHRLLRHTIFCSWTWNYWNNRYIWMKFELLRFDVFDIKLFRTKSSRTSAAPANRWDLFTNYFLVKLLLTSALEKFVILSGKPHWLSPFLLMYWSKSPHFYLRNEGFPR